MASVFMVFVSFSALLSQAWLKGDDFFFVFSDLLSVNKLYGAIHCYLTHVSRFGEFLGRTLGLSANRWQLWLISPVVLVSIPFILRCICGAKVEVTSWRMLTFFWFSVFLVLQTVPMENAGWRNFWCYGATVNYFWGSTIILLLVALVVSTLRKKETEEYRESWSRWLLLFCVGCCSGWCLESVSVVLVPLTLMAFLWCKVKKVALPRSCAWGVTGMCLGAFFLFASPGMHRRSVGEAASRALDVYSLTPEQVTSLVENLTPEKVNMLAGSSGVVNLAGIPMWQHVYFLPYLAESYWRCCWLPSTVFALLILFTLLLRPESWRRGIGIAVGVYAFSWLSACSYLGGCVPGLMSFQPQTIMVVVACSILFLQLQGRGSALILSLTTCALVANALLHLVPGGIEAWQYKKYEKMRFAEIERQKAEGRHVVVLPPIAWPSPPEDSLGLINAMNLTDDAESYPNSISRRFYEVQGIIQKKPSSNAER